MQPRINNSRNASFSRGVRRLVAAAVALPALALVGCHDGSLVSGGPDQGMMPTPTAGTPVGTLPPTGPVPLPPVTTTPPAGPEPGSMQPGTMQPGTMQPGTMQPGTMTPTKPADPGPVLPGRTRVTATEMPMGVYQILQSRCSMCHTYGQRDPAGWGSVLDLSRMISADIVVPGDPNNSRLWNRVAIRADMPFNGTRLSPADLEVLRAWIANIGRPFTRARSNSEILDLIVADQGRTGQGNVNRNNFGRNDTRYISFAHFVDEHRAADELRAAGAVLNLVINSLSRRQTLVQLQPIDAERTIYKFQLSDLGWDRRDWDRVTSFYPYCLRSDRQAHRDIYNRLDTEAPYVRGDWFLATVPKPPLYYDVLQLSDNLDRIVNDDLRIDINDDINRSRIQRIGFRSSGVSLHNRILERHRTRGTGYLWVSYDFDSDLDNSDIRANPLGPANRDNRFNQTFQNLAGEMIWSLPNGMQAYLLADANSNRLDKAVQTVVRDPRRQDGSVEEGISCFGCHGVTGMNQPRIYDEIPKYVADHSRDFSNNEEQEIRRIYPTNGQALVTADANAYLTKVKTLVGDLLPNPGVIEYDDFITMVGEYEAKVGLRAGAVELGADLATVRNIVAARRRNEDALPVALSDPLVLRDDFTCRYRRIVRDIQRDNFCQGTFDADEVRNFCDNR
jgi:mono/diheme cytochrome c family protein